MSNTVPDSDQRALALDPRQSFICEAPAGSGKTELLTQRLLTLLASVDQPEEIVAITFTRKAAGEMRHRVISALQKAVNGAVAKNDHEGKTLALASTVLKIDREKMWNIIESPSRLQIKTFDSLSSSLANTLPLHSSFAVPPQVSEDAEEIYTVAAQNFLMSLEDDVPWADSLATVQALLDNNTQKIEKLFARVLAQRETWLPLLGIGSDKNTVITTLESSLYVVREESVNRLKRSIPHYHHKTLLELAAFAASNIQRQGNSSVISHCVDIDIHLSALPDADNEGIKQWLGLAAILLSKTGSWRKSVDVRCGFPKGENAEERARYREKKLQCLALIDSLSEREGLRDQLLDIRYFPSEKYDDEQKQLLYALIDILPVLSAYLTLTFQEKNNVDFSEVSIKAKEALGKLHSPSELAMALDYKIKHILVDEFQDTSPMQFELLKQLTGGWEQGDGRTLFCVGDAMQSIYGFRGANVGLFLQAIEYGLGHVPLTHLRLSTNFRSQASVISWINTVFSAAFPPQNDISVGAVSYASSIAFQTGEDDKAVNVHGFSEELPLYSEANAILDIIRDAKASDPNNTTAILVRNRNHAMHITAALDDAGILYRAVDLEPLAENIVVQDLMALTHALLRPSDRTAWLSVLRAPWCGLSLVDLEAIATTKLDEKPIATAFQQLKYLVDLQGEASTRTTASNDKSAQADFFLTQEIGDDRHQFKLLTRDGRSRLARVLPVLACVMSHVQRKTLRQLVEGAWLALGGPACLKSPREIKNAALFFALLEKLDNSTILKRRDALEKAVSKLFSLPNPQSDEKLQVMTIHKAKGLEFDTVIVPSLHRSAKRQDPELLRWQERLTESGERHLLMSPITSSGREKDAVYAYLANQEKRRELNESSRLLYVACTRAKKRLHLMAFVKRDKKDTSQLKPPSKASLLHSVWASVQLQVKVYEKVDGTEEKPITHDKPRCLNRLNSQWQLPQLKEGHTLSQYVPFFQHENERATRIESVNPLPRIIGTFVHRLLRDLDETRLVEWVSQGIAHLESHWRLQLRSFGVPSGQMDAAISRVRLTINKIIDDKTIHWVFSSALPLRKNEYSLTIPTQSGFSQLIVDVMIFDGTSTWVIDYKTSQPEEGESRDDFLHKEMCTYREIMFKYKKAICDLGYKDVKLALYFPMINAWSEYPASA